MSDETTKRVLFLEAAIEALIEDLGLAVELASLHPEGFMPLAAFASAARKWMLTLAAALRAKQ